MLIRAVLYYFSSAADIKFRACAPLLEHVTDSVTETIVGLPPLNFFKFFLCIYIYMCINFNNLFQ